jgi:hypothetical protein
MTRHQREDITRYSPYGIPYQVSHNHLSNGEQMGNSIQQDSEDGQKPQQRRRTPVAVCISVTPKDSHSYIVISVGAVENARSNAAVPKETMAAITVY